METDFDKDKSNNNSRKFLSALKLLLLIGIVVGIPIYLFVTKADVLQDLGNSDNLNLVTDFLQEYRTESIFVYIGLQIIQIVISVLPGQIFQMAAGYLYGFPLGLLLSIIGAGLGSAIAYYLAVFLGHDALRLFIKPETMDHWVKRLNTKQAYIVVFLLYLIPGLPKDVIAYAAGIARMNVKAYLLMSLLGRIPAMSASILIGVFYETENYYGVGVVAAVSIVIFIICVIKRKSISSYLDRFYERING